MALVKYNNNSLSAVTSTAGMPAGAMTLIKEQTASSSATISFVHGTSDVVLDSTYPIYVFKWINIHQATNIAHLTFQGSTNTGSGYGVTATSTFFYASHAEAGGGENLLYWEARDLGQSTSFQPLGEDAGSDNDQNYCGELWLFSPSSTTYVKNFMSAGQSTMRSDYTTQVYTGGYFNTTSAIDAIQFKMNSGNMDAGTFKLYGIKDS